MEFELIHFPDFQNSFFGKEYCSHILETYITVRQRLSCRHITHITPKPSDVHADGENIKTVVSTVPADWVVNYASKNYFEIDPLFHQKWSDPQVSESQSIVEIYNEKQKYAFITEFCK